eukprot:10641189-Lingulodinium_polyedra.AAC.1
MGDGNSKADGGRLDRDDEGAGISLDHGDPVPLEEAWLAGAIGNRNGGAEPEFAAKVAAGGAAGNDDVAVSLARAGAGPALLQANDRGTPPGE